MGKSISLTGSQRSPPPDQNMRSKDDLTEGKTKEMAHLYHGELQQLATEPNAHSLVLINPHNLCYANSVLHMLHQARALAGRISGLGALN